MHYSTAKVVILIRQHKYQLSKECLISCLFYFNISEKSYQNMTSRALCISHYDEFSDKRYFVLFIDH